MKESDNLNRIQIVLIETQDGANVGSVCRAMKTMGISKLVLITEKTYDENRVRTLALHASDIWENRVVYKTLKEALKTSIYSVGATRRHGKFRKSDSLNPEQLSAKISKMGEGIVSIVFGREANGLTDDEVNSCSQIVTIPTSDSFPSLNLSQAVQIITYNLFNNLKPYPVGNTPVNKERVNIAVESSMEHIDDIGYFKQDQEKKWTTTFLKDVYERAQLTESEVKRLEKLFYKVSKIAKHKKL
jgi:tRNA/rRNA methyltransferase